PYSYICNIYLPLLLSLLVLHPFFFNFYGATRNLHSFPTRRSSDLSVNTDELDEYIETEMIEEYHKNKSLYTGYIAKSQLAEEIKDRKSTRLNSSHVSISYAVFCLKKKKA